MKQIELRVRDEQGQLISEQQYELEVSRGRFADIERAVEGFKARALAQKAVELDDHERAVDAGRKALRLSPHHPEWYAAFVGIALFAGRQYEEAIATMAPAPEALCNTPAFMAAAYAHLGQEHQGVYYRDTVRRHHRNQVARGRFSPQMSCLDWLLTLDPFQRAADVGHYADDFRVNGAAYFLAGLGGGCLSTARHPRRLRIDQAGRQANRIMLFHSFADSRLLACAGAFCLHEAGLFMGSQKIAI